MFRLCKIILILIGLSSGFTNLHAQSVYFPPLIGNQWDTISPNSLDWCEDSISSLYDFLEESNSKGFLVLKNGKIVLEKYFGTFTMDSAWYWASAGKTLTAFMIGQAQEKELLSIHSSSNEYLGNNWTSLTQEQEDSITVWHHLTMTTGLDYTVTDLNCKTPSCLTYLNKPGTTWFYHNAPYLLLQDVISNASGITFNQFTNQNLSIKTGMTGVWINGTFFSKPRSMARFGSLMLNKGIWNSDTLMKDTSYFNQMISTSQGENESYGYLWWLNGKSSFILPTLTTKIQGSLIPEAPSDMLCALGLNDQKLYVVPSLGLVVVRMGNPSGTVTLGPSSFDSQLWKRLMALSCENSSTNSINLPIQITIHPNPNNGTFFIQCSEEILTINVLDNLGKIVWTGNDKNVSIPNKNKGVYTICVRLVTGETYHRKMILTN